MAGWRAAVHAAWLEGDPPPESCGHDPVEIGGVRCLHRARPGAPLVVYLHGGGYSLGSPEVAVPITERLAVSTEIVSIDYRLAPEHPYPAGLDDCRTVYEAVRRWDPARPVTVAGDSAGANLAVSLGVGSADRPDALVLLSPHLDHAAHRRRGAPRGPSDDIDAAAAEWLAAAYCGSRDRSDPAVSPLHADLSGLPPTLVQVGGAEPLRAQAATFARRARQAGVDVTLEVWDELWHTWHYHRDLPEADRALAAAAEFVLGTVRAT